MTSMRDQLIQAFAARFEAVNKEIHAPKRGQGGKFRRSLAPKLNKVDYVVGRTGQPRAAVQAVLGKS